MIEARMEAWYRRKIDKKIGNPITGLFRLNRRPSAESWNQYLTTNRVVQKDGDVVTFVESSI